MIDGLAVTLLGPDGAEPLLLSPGLGGLGSFWRPQLAALQQRYRVILYDHRGTGASQRTLPHPYGGDELALDLRRILDGLGISRASIIGHAAGGIAGLQLALLHPERVARLVVINGWAVADPHFKRCFEIRTAIYHASGALAYLKAQPLFLFPATWISRHLAELDAQAASHAADFQDEATLLARISLLAGFDIQDRLTEITCPVLLLAAEDDMLVPCDCSSRLAEALPAARLILMPRGGHAMTVTEPDRVNAHLLAFLEGGGS